MTEGAPTAQEAGQARSLALTYDVAAYRQFVAADGMTEEEQARFLDAVWSVVVSFVDLGFGCHPVQQAMNVGKPRASLAADALAVLPCGTAFNKHSNAKAARRNDRPARKKES